MRSAQIRRRLRRVLITLGALFGALIIALPAQASTAGGSPDGHHSFNVSAARGHDSRHCGSYDRPCATIPFAVYKARPGSTINVWPGTYYGEVVITKRLHLVGHFATLDAKGYVNGFAVGGTLPTAPPTGPLAPNNARGSSVSGFTVVHALGEGILVINTSGITIAHNRVMYNDRGAGTNASWECAGQGNEPGDCGEGLHIFSSYNSVVVGNVVSHNVGGILITDEAGPAFGNYVAGNTVTDNIEDCGITMPSHNPGAVKNGILQQSVAGVYGNTVVYNVVLRNGGAGILMAVPFPGAAVYNNYIAHNFVSGNGNAGVTLHAHAPGQVLNGNVIKFNYIGHNNLAGDPDAGDKVTTGILISSPVVPINNTIIVGNHISHNQVGIWLTRTAASNARAYWALNTFRHVKERVLIAH